MPALTSLRWCRWRPLRYFDSRFGSADDPQSVGACRGLNEFIHRSVQTWNLTLVFLGSLALVFIEIWCAFSLVKGRNWARWVYLLTQMIAAGYLWAASLGYGYPELFSIPGESKREIFHSLVMQKLPDLLVLTLLFVPANCRRFFRLQ